MLRRFEVHGSRWEGRVSDSAATVKKLPRKASIHLIWAVEAHDQRKLVLVMDFKFCNWSDKVIRRLPGSFFTVAVLSKGEWALPIIPVQGES